MKKERSSREARSAVALIQWIGVGLCLLVLWLQW